MNLKENYERLFGKMTTENKLGYRTKTQPPNQLSEHQQQKFVNIQKSYQQQYPTKQLKMKSGYVMIDNLIVEKVETFFKKNNNQIANTLKSFTKKII